MSSSTITLLFLLFAVIMFVLEKIPLGVTSMIVCCGLVVTRVLDVKTAFAGFIDSNVILFVAMFIVGGALFETGMANKIGGIVTKFASSERTLIVCCLLTNFMSNTATTALMAPICMSIAQGMGADPRAVLMACVIGGSCAYATPIGMPANTMVVGAGGYTFMDYVKAGFPLIIIATVVSMIILPIAFPFFP